MKNAVCIGCLLLLAAVVCQSAGAEMTTVRVGVPPVGRAKRAAPLPTAYVVEAKTAIAVDGVLDEPAWRQAVPLALGTMTGRGRPGAATEVRLLHRDGQLFIGFRLTEPRVARMRRKVTKFDGPAYQDDSVEIFLSPRGGSRWCQFIVAAGGGLLDSKDRNKAWNSGSRHGVVVGSKSWSVELAIPFSALGVGKGKLGTWRGNFYRSRHAGTRGENNAWSPTGRNDYDVPGRFGRIKFGPPPPPKRDEGPKVAGKPAKVLSVANGEAVVQFDISGLPRGVRILRADLLLFRDDVLNGFMNNARTKTVVYPLPGPFKAGEAARPSGGSLAIRGPWYDRLDATAAVRKSAGKRTASFFIKSCPLVNAAGSCLDIAYEGAPKDVPPQVAGVKASHRFGQTFITWKEIADPVGTDETTWGTMRAVLAGLDTKERVRYCVYRSTRPITARTLPQAKLIATVKPLSCWNINARNTDRPVDIYIATAKGLMTGHGNPFGRASIDGKYGRDCPVERFVIKDGDRPLPRGTGLYVHTPAVTSEMARGAYYAVVTSVNGVQNTRDVSDKNTTSMVREVAGVPSLPVLQGELPRMPFFNFKQKRLHYVRWVAPLLTNKPSEYHNWSVGVPEPLAKNVPLELNLHRDGHSFWRTHYRIERDSVVICPYDFPVRTWWYGHHESLGTLKSFSEGAIQPYTERRLLAFINWAASKWPVDRNRVLVTGCRGGGSGSGALRLALRHPKVFNVVITGHPYMNYVGPANNLGRRGIGRARSLRAIWGEPGWKLRTEGGKDVWEELDLNRLVATLPASVELPFMTVTSNHGYAACRKFYEQTLTKHFPIMASFSWGGARYVPVSNTGTYPNVIRLDIRKNKALLAFTSAQGLKFATKGGMGDFNRNLRWKDVTDEPGKFEVTIFMSGRGSNVADVIPRRLQNFRVVRGKTYVWRNVSPDGKTELQKGEAAVADDGLLVLRGVRFSGGSRLVVTPKP